MSGAGDVVAEPAGAGDVVAEPAGAGDVVAELAGASVAYDGAVALHGVDLVVTAGEVVALLGANGSGKSTSVRALLGLVPLVAGRAELFGIPVSRFRHWPRIGYVPQRSRATSGVPATVQEVVAAGRLSRARRLRPPSSADRAAVQQALDAVELADRAGDSIDALSGGQQQRVLIARALASDPELLLLDEPNAGVDLAHQEQFAATLERLVARGLTVVLVLHELGPVAPLITRAVTLEAGRVLHDGRPPTVEHVHLHDPQHAHPPHRPRDVPHLWQLR